jgi:CO dehydrogenase maturation factor
MARKGITRMKWIVCGKGGCGKSTLAVLISRALARLNRRVLLVDADESNLGLHRLAGVPRADTLLETLGGKAGLRGQTSKALGPSNACGLFYQNAFGLDEIPASCTATLGGIRLLKIGKIQRFGEGCACPMGGLLRPFLAKLQDGPEDRVIVDTAAGVEHFGRNIDANCDRILGVIDPTFESFKLAKQLVALSHEAGRPLSFVLNKADQRMRGALGQFIDPRTIQAEIPMYEALFLAGLEGRPIDIEAPEVDDLVRRLEAAA